MRDEDKTREQLISELAEMRQWAAGSEALETDRKRIQEALRMLEKAVETTQIGVTITDTEGKILYTNPAEASMHGYAVEDLIGKDVRIFCPETLSRPMTFEELKKIKRWKRESINIRRDGNIFPVHVMSDVVTDVAGNPIGVITGCEDITERKQAEEVRLLMKMAEARAKAVEQSSKELENEIAERRRAEEKIREQAALLDITRDAILVRDLEGQILFWNRGAQCMYGWMAEEVIGRNINEVLYKGDLSQTTEACKSVIEQGEWTGELQQVTKDGHEVTVESRWTLVRDPEGKPKSILMVNTNITEKKELEAQFFRAQRMESIGTLASGIAHDLNNVLAPVLMAVQILRGKLPDERSQQLLTTLEVTIQRGADLIRQVLSFGRGFEGRQMILQVSHLILEMERIAKETFPKSIGICTDIPKDIWTIYGDATQLHQVLMNLCVNARDAMPNSGTLSISAKNILIDEHYARLNINSRVGRYIVISVSDTGTGIPREILDRIFSPFFTTKELGKGTGLGLSTVTGIIKNHGGFVDVYSEVGKGTEFKVYLPASEITEMQRIKSGTFELPTGHGELILIVDDEASIREIAKASLEAYGYKVLTANDGVEAVVTYTQHKEEISIVLLDMMMPIMDGSATIHALQKINPQVKIIAASGIASGNKIAEAAQIGIKTFLSKPYTAGELLTTLHKMLSTK